MKKIFLYLLIVSMIAVFSLAGCETEAAEEVTEEEAVEEPVEESVIEEPVVEEVTVEPEEETLDESEAVEIEEEAVPSDEVEEEAGTITDIDGNVYHTVTIGTQVWLVENLKVTHYRNGDPIPNVTDDAQWNSLTTGAYCNYSNDANNTDTYGCLYNWYAVNDGRNICPTGWHVPTNEEWSTLEMYLGGSSVAGGKMAEAGTTHWSWLSPYTGATNESGFTALPGGFRFPSEGYEGMGSFASFWSSTEVESDYAGERNLNCYDSEVGSIGGSKTFGHSVRCVQD